MTYIENSITKSFTIGHAKRTLEDICSNIDRCLNDKNSDLNKEGLQAISRHLYNAIENIKSAEQEIKNS